MYKITKEKFYTTFRLSKLIKKYSRGTSLDAGCGTGEYFKDFKGDNLYGIDITPGYLKQIKKEKYKNKKIILKVADVKKLQFKDEMFDFVFSAAVLEYMKNKKELDLAISELKRVLKPGGKLVVSTPHKNAFTLFVRKELLRRIIKQNAQDPFFIMGREYSKKTLENYGFKVYGCLGWVTWKNIQNKTIAQILDIIFWHFPSLSGSLVGVYEKK